MKNNFLFFLLFFAFACCAGATHYPDYFVDIEAGKAKNDSRILLRPFQGYLRASSIEYDVEDLEKILNGRKEMAPNDYYEKDQIYSWLILEYENGNYKFAGIIQTNFKIDYEVNGEYAELAFYIHPDFRRQGFAYQSSVALMKHLLSNKVNLIGIVFAVATNNTACRALMSKFQDEFGFIMSSKEVAVGELLNNKIYGHRYYRYVRGKEAEIFDPIKTNKLLINT